MLLKNLSESKGVHRRVRCSLTQEPMLFVYGEEKKTFGHDLYDKKNTINVT